MSSPFDPDRSLTGARRQAEPALPEPPRAAPQERPRARYRIHPGARLFVRGPWELAASLLIGIGVLMLMQPFFLWAYTWSFLVTLTGTVMFIIVSHFPD